MLERTSAIRWYVVFDAHDGRVVHTHQFITLQNEKATEADTMSLRSQEEEKALLVAKQSFEGRDLRVMYVPAAMELGSFASYRVDLESGELKQQGVPVKSLIDLLKRRRATKTSRNS